MQDLSPEKKLLIFLHIPKAAGTTFKHVLRKQYGQNAIASLPIRDNQNSLKCFIRSSSIFEEEYIKVISGHTIYGVHQHLKRQAIYFSFVREPVSRVISDYYYLLRSKDYPNHDYVVKNNLTLKEYILSGKSKLIDNFQTRVLSGVGEHPDFAQCSQDMLEQAKKNICNDFVLLGIVERFDETLLLLRHLLNWKSEFLYPYPLYFKMNQTQKRLSFDNLDASTIQVIKNYNQLDIELYKFAVDQFEVLIQRNRSGFLNDNEISKYKFANKYYSLMLNFYVASRKKINNLIGQNDW